MTISSEHPFQPAESERSPVRRLRGRLAGGVTVWTTADASRQAGLTVSSLLVADGDPGWVLGLVDPDSDFVDLLRDTRTAVINLLSAEHRQLADAFGFVAPAPGGPFRLARWQHTSWGPALDGALAWAGVRLAEIAQPSGWWSARATLQIERIELPHRTGDAVVHHRGRYLAVPAPPAD